MSKPALDVHSYNRPMPFLKAWELQKKLLDLRIRDEIPDTALFLEHELAITRGRGLQWTGQARPRQMPLIDRAKKLPFFEIERGGDLTVHLPGQWVMYPIFKLDGQGFAARHDVGAWIRSLEGLLMEGLKRWGLSTIQIENSSGLWINSAPQRNLKLASIGIAIRRWTSFHGLALNMTNDLKPFSLFSPCGFDSSLISKVAEHTKLEQNWRGPWEAEILKILSQSYPKGSSHFKISP